MAPVIVPAAKIRELLEKIDISTLERALEEGFRAYSEGTAIVPFPAHLDFPEGDCHIRYGRVEGEPFFVVKVATGFYQNSKQGLPSGDGYLAVHSQETGRLQAILLDEGQLTDVRTALAGRIAAKYLAPSRGTIGIVGTGVQAKLQLRYLEERFRSWPVKVWGRTPESVHEFIREMTKEGFTIEESGLPELTRASSLIITTTPSRAPLMFAEDIRPGVHITAVGADGGGKHEIDQSVFARADRIVVDSIGQCSRLGDSSFAISAGTISEEQLIELGALLGDPSRSARRHDEEITIADLTGLAVQDIKIATSIYEAWCRER